MDFLPVSLNVKGKRIIIIGAGKVALHKLKTIKKFNACITVIAPEIMPAIKKLGVALKKESYQKSLLKGAFLVYACTNDRALNKRIREDALAKGILVNVADDRRLCEFISPAVCKHRNLIISVSSQGRDPAACVALRDKIKRRLNGDRSIRA